MLSQVYFMYHSYYSDILTHLEEKKNIAQLFIRVIKQTIFTLINKMQCPGS